MCFRSSRPPMTSASPRPCRGCDNVILTPHIGGSTEEAQERIGGEVARKLIEYSDVGSTYGAVNFPQVQLPPRPTGTRFIQVHQNLPGEINRLNDDLRPPRDQYRRAIFPDRRPDRLCRARRRRRGRRRADRPEGNPRPARHDPRADAVQPELRRAVGIAEEPLDHPSCATTPARVSLAIFGDFKRSR